MMMLMIYDVSGYKFTWSLSFAGDTLSFPHSDTIQTIYSMLMHYVKPRLTWRANQLNCKENDVMPFLIAAW